MDAAWLLSYRVLRCLRSNPLRWALAVAATAFPAVTACGQAPPDNCAPAAQSAAEALHLDAEKATLTAGEYTLKTAGDVEIHDRDTAQPSFKFNFSLDRSGDQNFRLRAGQITATIDGRTSIPIGDSDLVSNASENPSVVIALDGSLSMKHADKLEAAKSAIRYFLEELRQSDRVALFSFDQRSDRLLADMSLDRDGAKQALEHFQLDPNYGEWTSLYEAMESAIGYAQSNDARYVIFVTDGMEDTKEFPDPDSVPGMARGAKYKESEYIPHKRKMEQEIIRLAGAQTVVYTIALGQENATDRYAGVDRETLSTISDQTNAGTVQDAVAKTLQGILAKIDRYIHYEYSLWLRPPAGFVQPGNLRHEVRIEFAPQDHGDVLPAGFTYLWPKGEGESPGSVHATFPQVFLPTATYLTPRPCNLEPESAPAVRPLDQGLLAKIYLQFASLLGLLSLIPPMMRWLERKKQRTIANRSVTVVRDGSPYLGKSCGTNYPHAAIAKNEPVVICPGRCKRPYHLACWHNNRDECYTIDCGTSLSIPREVLEAYGVRR
jgi:Mg-chelatase subunit ChlD